ncbi:MAG: hypothetical protein IKU15_02815 [Clostridia bacterium]|nr:hypothetical protein [Clostridia bacterium]
MKHIEMNMDERIQKLRTINFFNFYGPFFFNKERDTDFAIAKSAQDILTRYEKDMKRKVTIILKYDNDFYSYLAYRMISFAAGAKQIEINLRILGEIKTDQEKEIFKEFKTISWHKARKIKNAIFVTGYHPIYNVIDLSSYSKTFVEILNPIERFAPDVLTTAQEFYLNSDSPLWSIFLEGRDDDYLESAWEGRIDKDIPLCVFDLQGNEDDFPVFNFILKSAREGNIHLYIYKNEEQSEFIFNNLRPYLETRNVPDQINMITMDEYRQLWTSSTNEDGSINNEIHFFDIDNLPEEDEDENSDC